MLLIIKPVAVSKDRAIFCGKIMCLMWAVGKIFTAV